MASEFPSVDDFVAAYLSNCELVPAPQQGVLTANGMQFTGVNMLPNTYQQAVGTSSQQCPAAAQASTAPHQPGIPGRWEQGSGDVYMQPYDQMAHQHMSMNQYPQQQDWQLQLQLQQLQQQQLQLLHEQRQQQQHHQQQQQHHQLQQQQQQQQQLQQLQQQAAIQAAHLQVNNHKPQTDRSGSPKSGRQSGSGSQQTQQQESSNAAAGRRNGKISTSARAQKVKIKREQQEVDMAVNQAMMYTAMDGFFANPDLGHTASAPAALSHVGAVPASAPVAPAAYAGGAASFSAFGQHQQGNLTNVLMMQQAYGQQVLGQQQQQQQHAMQQQAQGQMQPGAVPEEDEPDMTHLTVMQRYHARRKLAVQRMEREVEEKIAQLAMLEQENRQLKWQAHILENMLLDMDKQVELMSTTDELPDASQWLTLLGMGTNAATGSSGRITRTLHKMLEGAAAVDIVGWTAQDCRRRWLAYLEQLRPLVEQAEAAQAAYKASQGCSSSSSEQQSSGMVQRRPRRAAAAAAVAVIKQEAAEVLGMPPLPVCPVSRNIPDVPVAPCQPGASKGESSSRSLGSSPAAQPAAAAAAGEVTSGGGGTQQQQQYQQQGAQGANNTGGDGAAAPLASEHSLDSDLSHGPNIEGVPCALLSRIEDLVLHNFYWLLAIMTRNPVLTYEFISVDLVEGRTPLPPQQHEMWAEGVERCDLTLAQQHECCTCLQVARRCMAKVIEERAEITAAMQPYVMGANVRSPMSGQQSQAWLSADCLVQNQADVTVDRMRANVRKESVVRNLVGFYCINVVSLFQLAQMSLSCSPYFCMAWRVIEAVEAKLTKQLESEAAQQQQQTTGHNTRSSTRLAGQR